jgi:hypothetical protein
MWLLLALAPLAAAAEEIGDPAPALVVKEWIKGGPVEIKPGTNIFVVVIWGTKGDSELKAITKLNELQTKYRDQGVVIVGISDESPEQIRNFVEQPDVKIDYAIGADTARRTSISYMLGFKLHTIPRAFIVGKDGKFMWQGNPLNGLDVMLAEVVAGRYQLERAKKADMVRVQMEVYRSLSHRGDPRARAAGESLIEGWTNNARYLSDFAYFIVNDTRNPNRDFPLAEHALDLAEKSSQTNTVRLLTTRVVVLLESGKPDEAITLLKSVIAASKDPKEKAALEPFLKRAEARAKELKARHSSANTNQVDSASGTNAVSGTNATPPGPSARPLAPHSGKKENSPP